MHVDSFLDSIIWVHIHACIHVCICICTCTCTLYAPYNRKFSWDKIFANAVKVAISAMQFLTQEEKIFSWWKFPAVWYLIIIVCTFATIPYSRKIWRGTKFGGLVDCLSNRQIKIRQNFLLAYMYMYGDPVPNHQNFSQTLVWSSLDYCIHQVTFPVGQQLAFWYLQRCTWRERSHKRGHTLHPLIVILWTIKHLS